MRRIGGFIGLEPAASRSASYHNALALTTGRACLALLVKTIRPRRIYLPYYICPELFQAFAGEGMETERYGINRLLEIDRELTALGPDDVLLYVNYFGLKGNYCERLSNRYGQQLIVDDTQAFFQKGYPSSWSFNSARKFFGVADGAFLYSPRELKAPDVPRAAPSTCHLHELHDGKFELAYRSFRLHEDSLDGTILKISEFSEQQLKQINYEAAARHRRENYEWLAHHFGNQNELRLSLSQADVPLCYPYLATSRDARDELIGKNIFVPTFWPELPEVRTGEFAWERNLADCLIPLPIDQRYNVDDMRYIAHTTGQIG